MLRLSLLLRIMVLLSFVVLVVAAEAAKNPVEVGTVQWGRNLEYALEQSAESGKPVLLLFQEVPGCAGCKLFGKTVLSEALLVEAIESEFHPVLIYNNQAGYDKKILEHYREPAWNYQVLRFLNASGKDVIARKDKVWSTKAVATRMQEALIQAQRTVPLYLEAAVYSDDAFKLKHLCLSMHCFWTAELHIGAIDGVVKIEAGFFDGREVVRVWYDEQKLQVESLINQARKHNSAQYVYVDSQQQYKQLKSKYSFTQAKLFAQKDYRKAPISDQKKQINTLKVDLDSLTDFQRCKVNAFYRTDPKRALEFLSPRQKQSLE